MRHSGIAEHLPLLCAVPPQDVVADLWISWKQNAVPSEQDKFANCAAWSQGQTLVGSSTSRNRYRFLEFYHRLRFVAYFLMSPDILFLF